MLQQKLKNNLIHLPRAIYYNYKYKFPSKKLKVIGVTGTDGKTTTSNMIYHILNDMGYKVGLISTISAKYLGEEYDTGFHVTSPDPSKVQEFLYAMVNKGVEVVILETTSHALDQYRYWGVEFDIALFTNITHEHLDYHKTYLKYVEAKLSIIDNLKPNGFVITNYDDASFDFIKTKLKAKYSDLWTKKIFTFGKTGDEEHPSISTIINNIVSMESGLSLELTSEDGLFVKPLALKLKTLGEYNAYNATASILAVIALLKQLNNFEENAVKKIINAIKNFEPLVGRMQIMGTTKNKATIIVDFAHTPNALQNALETIKSTYKTKTTVVFGCAGLRDITKRFLMGEIAAELADNIILVPEDPRTENLKSINDQIIQGINKSKNKFELDKNLFVFNEENVNSRIDGIKKAIEITGKDEVVIITGKGHEKSLCFGTIEYPFTDQESVLQLLS